MKPTLYTTLNNREWTNPPSAGLYPTIQTNATADLQDQLQIQHEEGLIIYNDTGTIDESLNNEVIGANKYTYLKYLRISTPDYLDSCTVIFSSIWSINMEISRLQI